MIKYYPYKSDKPNKNIILLQTIIKKFILVRLALLIFIKMKQENNYINRHKNNVNWTKSGIDTAGFWSRWLLWHLPTIKESYQDIKKRFNINFSYI